MLPELFHIGPIPIRSYGLMLAISFLLGIWYIWYVSKRDEKPFDRFLTIAYIMVIGGLVGARLAYVLLHVSEFSGHWTDVFNPFHSGTFGIAGMNLYGGILLAIIGAAIYCLLTGMSILDVFDYFAPTVGIGLTFTRIGCFMNGCCFGTPCNLPWAVKFPPGSIPYSVFGGQTLHPSQLYSSLYGVLLFVILHFMLKNRRFFGQVVAVYFMVEAFFRFIIEYVRYYENAMIIPLGPIHPTFNQIVSVLLFMLGLVIYLVQRGRLPKSEALA
jgi:phosphatidylglycerol:prolipoprotein diacylglycerol transferase